MIESCFFLPQKIEVNRKQRQRSRESRLPYPGRENQVKAWQRRQISKIS